MPDFILSSPTKSIAVIFIALLFYGVMNLEATPAQETTKFQLLLQWPPSYCSMNGSCCSMNESRCCPSPKNFSIHGLWKTGSCKGPPAPFNFSEIRDLESKLNEEWPSLNCSRCCNNEEFWQYEWQKHGKCTQVLKQHEYFVAALQLKERVNILHELQKHDIQPNGSAYNLVSIHRALKEVTGHDVMIECNKINDHMYQLYQIHLYVEYGRTFNFTNPRNGRYYNKCDMSFPNVKFPPLRFPPLKDCRCHTN